MFCLCFERIKISVRKRELKMYNTMKSKSFSSENELSRFFSLEINIKDHARDICAYQTSMQIPSLYLLIIALKNYANT